MKILPPVLKDFLPLTTSAPIPGEVYYEAESKTFMRLCAPTVFEETGAVLKQATKLFNSEKVLLTGKEALYQVTYSPGSNEVHLNIKVKLVDVLCVKAHKLRTGNLVVVSNDYETDTLDPSEVYEVVKNRTPLILVNNKEGDDVLLIEPSTGSSMNYNKDRWLFLMHRNNDTECSLIPNHPNQLVRR